MTVSALKKTSGEHCTVVLEDGSEIKSTLNTVTDLRLYSGKELDDNALEELKRLSARALSRQHALMLLSRRQYSKNELYKKLIEKGEDEQAAEDCVAWLAENRLIDDEYYAGAVARHYTAKGYGAGRVKAELARRGIDRELMAQTLETLTASDDMIDKFISSRLRDPGDPAEVRKISNALFRRGYSWDEIKSALRRHSAETEDCDG